MKIWKTNKNVPGRGVSIKAMGRTWEKCESSRGEKNTFEQTAMEEGREEIPGVQEKSGR